MKTVQALCFLAFAGVLSGCISGYSHSLTNAPAGSTGTPVFADDTSLGVLSLTAPAPDVAPALLRACPSGKLAFVETDATVRNWVIVQAYRVQAKAICLP